MLAPHQDPLSDPPLSPQLPLSDPPESQEPLSEPPESQEPLSEPPESQESSDPPESHEEPLSEPLEPEDPPLFKTVLPPLRIPPPDDRSAPERKNAQRQKKILTRKNGAARLKVFKAWLPIPRDRLGCG
jgi:hypothetical protein